MKSANSHRYPAQTASEQSKELTLPIRRMGPVVFGAALIAAVITFQVHLPFWLPPIIGSFAGALVFFGYFIRRRAEWQNAEKDRIKVAEELKQQTGILRATKAELQQSEQYLQEYVEHQGDIVLRLDDAGKLIFVNDVFCQIFGVERDAVLNSPYSFESRSAVRFMDFEQNNIRRLDQQIMTVTGWRWFAWRELIGDDDQVLRVGRDISVRKQAEQKLNEAKERESQANQAKTSMMATLGHEVQTPINGLVGMANLLLSTDLTSEQRNYTRTIYESADALNAMVQEVLEYAQVESGVLRLRTIEFDIQELLQNVAELMAPQANAKGITILAEIDPTLPRILRGEVNRVRQVLLHIVGNAINFTGKGGVLIAAKATKPKVHGRNVNIRFSVHDTGIGIAREAQANLFDEFTQINNPASPHNAGTGLGLAISKRLISLLGGDIRVDSQPGYGSEFWFDLDLETVGDGCRPVVRYALENSRILVVDSNPVSLKFLTDLIAGNGAKVEAVANANAALQALWRAEASGERFNCAVIDLNLSDLGGDALVRTIKEDSTITDPYMLVNLEPSQRGKVVRLREDGFDAFALKPTRRDHLLLKLTEALGRASAWVDDISVNPAADDASYRSYALPRRNARVLLAEDNEINRILAEALLEKLDAQVTTAKNGSEAVDAVQNSVFDLILMDVRMPEMDGLEATRNIRSLSGERGRVPIIAMTGNIEKTDKVECFEAGMDDHLTKPIDLHKIEMVLDAWQGEKSTTPIRRAIGASL